MALLYLSLAFVLGIYFGAHFPLALSTALPAATAVTAAAVLWRKKRHILVCGLCISVFLSGALRFSTSPTGDGLQPYIGAGTVNLTAVVAEEPEPGESYIKLILTARELDGEKLKGTVLVYTTRYPTYQYGDMIELSGELEEPTNFNDFDYRTYLQRQGIYALMYYPDVEFVEGGHGPQPLQSIYSFRHRLGEVLAASLSEPEGSLARGILLGLRHDIPADLYRDFQRSGTAHLLAISGLHLAIVAGMALSISVWAFGRHRPTYMIVALSVLWGYAMLSGMSPSVTRAAIMVSLFLLGTYVGRQRSGIIAVAFAAAIMLALDPMVLWSVSFQLSFAAVLGLILISPVLTNWLTAIRLPRIIIDGFAYSLGAIFATFPLVAYHFGYISLVSPFATFITMLSLPAVIALSAIVGVVGLISTPAAQAIGWTDWPLLKYMTSVVHGLGAWEYSWLRADWINAGFVWLYYFSLGAATWVASRKLCPASDISSAGSSLSKAIRWAIVPLGIIAVLLWLTVVNLPDRGKLSVSFLDVGQGDSILITSPLKHHILVDGGPSPERLCLELGDAMTFWERKIDLVILTHSHSDHVTGLVEVLRRYDVEHILYSSLYPMGQTSGTGFDVETSPAYSEFCEMIGRQDIDYMSACLGQSIDIGHGASIEILNPPAEPLSGTDSDEDNNCVVLRVVMGGVSFLLTSDLYWDGELHLVCERLNLRSTVLKVSHHGSSSSTCPEFLTAVDPQVAVISVGADNGFGHPTQEVMHRLIYSVGEGNIYLTADDGTITFTTDGESLWVETER